MRIYIITHGHRVHIPQAGYPLHRAHTIHEVTAPQYYMGVDPGVRPVVQISRESSYLCNPTQTTDLAAQPHNGFYRDLSLTDDWLICLSCDHTWCCHPVVGNIPFAP